MNETQRYLTLSQLLEIVPLKKSRVYYLVHTGGIPHFHVGRTLLFDREEIQSWLTSLKEQPCHKHT